MKRSNVWFRARLLNLRGYNLSSSGNRLSTTGYDNRLRQPVFGCGCGCEAMGPGWLRLRLSQTTATATDNRLRKPALVLVACVLVS